MANGQDAVVDSGEAAVGIAAAEDDLADADLGQIVAGAQVTDRAGDIERAGAAAERRIAVQGDVAGPGIVAGDVLERPVAEDARPVERDRLGNDAGDVAHLEL